MFECVERSGHFNGVLHSVFWHHSGWIFIFSLFVCMFFSSFCTPLAPISLFFFLFIAMATMYFVIKKYNIFRLSYIRDGMAHKCPFMYENHLHPTKTLLHIYFHIEMCWVHSAHTENAFYCFVYVLFSAFRSSLSSLHQMCLCRRLANAIMQVCAQFNETISKVWNASPALLLNRIAMPSDHFDSISMNYWCRILCFYALIWKYCFYIFRSVSICSAVY